MKSIGDIISDSLDAAKATRDANIKGRRKKKIEDSFFAGILDRCHPRVATTKGTIDIPLRKERK